MAPEVWIAADTLGYPTGAGHLWAYLNWALGLRGIGCEVVWLEPCREHPGEAALRTFVERLAAFGVNRICLFGADGGDAPVEGVTLVTVSEAASADLLLNIAYDVPPPLLARFRRTALLDIDPGMTQTWVAAGDVKLGSHDVYLTTGQGIANGTAPVPDCGIRWMYAAPCAALDVWTPTPPPDGGAYSTVTHWWGDSSFVMPDGQVIDNTKRSSFLPYLPVANKAGVRIDLAVAIDDLDEDASLLADHGWSVTDPVVGAGTPERYRSYVAGSRGEFSCAKPAYSALLTGWISDRTVCYLASGRPAIIQDTGPCRLLDDVAGEGVLRFSEPEEATAALVDAERDHSRQCAMARSLAEQRFDARKSAAQMLELCLP